MMLRRAILAFALLAGVAHAQVPPPVPALPDTERRISYLISGTTCACSLGANLNLYGDGTDYQNWVEVFLNGVRVNFNDATFGWTITSQSGTPLANLSRPITDGILTFTNVQTGTVQIVGARRPRRTAQFTENQPVPARNLNYTITDIVAMLREDWDKINDVTGRAVLGLPGETMALLPPATTRANTNACFDPSGNLTSCVSIPSAVSFIAGNGILFTGTNPVTIKNNIQAGNGIAITGTNPLTIANNIQAGQGVTFTGSNPIVISAGGLSNSSVTGATTTFTSAQCNINVERSNSGAAMSDLLPGTGAGILPANCIVTITNSDASALQAVGVASGAAIKGKLPSTGFLYLGPGQTLQVQSDGANYWPISTPSLVKLGASTTLFVSVSGSSANNGLTASTPLASITSAFSLAQVNFFANGFTLTISAADGTYPSQSIVGRIAGQLEVDVQNSVFPVIIQGDLVTPDNALINDTTSAGGFIASFGASALVQGFALSSSSGNALAAVGSHIAFKTVDFKGAGINHVLATHRAFVEIAGSYTISGNAASHWLASDGSAIYAQATSTITLTGTPAFSTAFVGAQYPSVININVAPTFTGSATGPRYVAFLNGIINSGVGSTCGSGTFFPGSSAGSCSTGGQYN